MKPSSSYLALQPCESITLTMRLFLLTITVLCMVSSAMAQYEATLVADINPGPESAIRESIWDQDYFSPAVYDGRLFFAADDGVHGRELWVYDAAINEVSLAVDINPGLGSSFLQHLIVYDGRLFFEAYNGDSEIGREIWVYDSATDEVSLAADISPSTIDGIDFPVLYDNRLFFNAYDSENGYELWFYDAAKDVAALAADINPVGWSYPTQLTVYDDKLFFAAEDFEFGRELWSYDAVTEEATRITDINPGSGLSLGDDLLLRFAVYDDRLFFVDARFNYDLWAYDVGTDETSLIKEAGGYFYLTNYDERLFFRSGFYDAATGETSTVSLGDHLTVYDSKLFYSRRSNGVGFYDATTGEASPVAENDLGDDSYPDGFVVYDGKLFFSAESETYGRELWALSPASVSNAPSASPQTVRLHTPYPNPVEHSASITFETTEAGSARVEVFDVLGRRVAVLADGPVAAGKHTVLWDAGSLPSGVYLVRLTAGDAVQTQRLTLAR